MTLGIVGGRLQGLEAAYLAGKAGWRTRLVDRRAAAAGDRLPAAGLCDQAVQVDCADMRQLDRALGDVDLVLPALENGLALEALCRWAESSGVPLAFDLTAWQLSSSKRASHELFARLAVPMPRPWPGCPFPVLAKPDAGSGSEEVRVYRTPGELEAAQRSGQVGPETVLQEFLSGPSYSLEVLGRPGAYRAVQVTDLGMDAGYDCKRVQAPTALAPQLVRRLEHLSLVLAEGVGLRGLMDVEAILHDGALHVLEIDARLPSQTPTAVYWSTGINMVEELAALVLPDLERAPRAASTPRAVVFEHIRVDGDVLAVGGEHLIAGAGGIRLQPGLFGSDEALSDYASGRESWVATLIVTAADLEQAWARRWEVIQEIMGQTGAVRYRDPEPESLA